MTPEDILKQIEKYEAAASPGPWTAVGRELYVAPGRHVPLPGHEDAVLTAVLRNWVKDLIADSRRLRELEGPK